MLRPLRVRGAGRFLAPAEQVVLKTRRHPVLLARPVLIWLAAVGGLAVLSVLLVEKAGLAAADRIAGWLTLGVTAYLAYRVIEWWRSYYVVTNERVLLLEGVVSVHVAAVRLARVTETSFTRSILGRLLGYGQLELDSAGEKLSLARLSHLPRAEEVYRTVTSLLIGHQAAPAPHDPREATTGPLPPIRL